jgi:hypothetical protein
MELAERRGLVVIEDCAQSHGAEIDGRPAGSFGHAASFSFCQDKIITTGRGGLHQLQDDLGKGLVVQGSRQELEKVNDPAGAGLPLAARLDRHNGD